MRRELTVLQQRLLAAHHEAGHAVAYAYAGFEVEQVSIEQSGDTEGHTTVIVAGVDEPAIARRCIVPVLSGYAAECFVLRTKEARPGAVRDFERARQLIVIASTGRRLEYYIARARAFVARPRNRSAIEGTANALLRRGTVEWSELQRILEGTHRARR